MDSPCQCIVCYETYSDIHLPKTLPCGHSLCSICIGSLRQQKCPLCNEYFVQPPSKFKTTYALLDLAKGSKYNDKKTEKPKLEVSLSPPPPKKTDANVTPNSSSTSNPSRPMLQPSSLSIYNRSREKSIERGPLNDDIDMNKLGWKERNRMSRFTLLGILGRGTTSLTLRGNDVNLTSSSSRITNPSTLTLQPSPLLLPRGLGLRSGILNQHADDINIRLGSLSSGGLNIQERSRSSSAGQVATSTRHINQYGIDLDKLGWREKNRVLRLSKYDL